MQSLLVEWGREWKEKISRVAEISGVDYWNRRVEDCPAPQIWDKNNERVLYSDCESVKTKLVKESDLRMKKKKFTVEQIIQILAEGEKGNGTIASVCRKYGIAEGTYYRWKREYKDFSIPEAKRLKMLEEKNKRLKKLLAERDLENYTLKEIVKGSLLNSRGRAEDKGSTVYKNLA